MNKKKFESKLRDVLKLLWELIPEAEKKAPDNHLYREGAKVFENFLKNNTDTFNEACSVQKALEGEGLQAYKINDGQGLPNVPTEFFVIFAPALRDLLSIACNPDKDDYECEKIIQEVLKDFKFCRTL